MKSLSIAALSVLMLTGIAIGTSRTAPAPATAQEPTIVLADTTAPPPLCDPTYQKNCKIVMAAPAGNSIK